MTRQEMINYIINYISTDANLLIVMRLAATKNILQIPDDRLAEIIAIIINP